MFSIINNKEKMDAFWDEEIKKALVQIENKVDYNKINPLVLNKKEIAIKVVSEYDCFSIMSYVWRNDDDVVRAAINKYPDALEFASERLKSNEKFILTFDCADVYFISFIDEELKKNSKKIALKIIKNCLVDKYIEEIYLSDISDELLNNEEVLYAVLKRCPNALLQIYKRISPKIKRSKKFKDNILGWIEKAPRVIGLFDKYVNNIELIGKLIKDTPQIYFHISEEAQHNEDFINVIKFYTLTKEEYDYQLPKFLYDRKDVMLVFIMNNLNKFYLLSEDLKNDIEIVEKAILQDYKLLTYVGDKLKKNREMYLSLIKLDHNLLSLLPKEFKNDPEIAMIAIRKDIENIRLVNEDILPKEFVIEMEKEIIDNKKELSHIYDLLQLYIRERELLEKMSKKTTEHKRVKI